MTLYKNSYKGKWFVLSDEDDSMYGSEGTMEYEELTDSFLLIHATNCLYYGIPMYTGVDKELRARCDAIMEKLSPGD
jgi:hypothetical protein